MAKTKTPKKIKPAKQVGSTPSADDSTVPANDDDGAMKGGDGAAAKDAAEPQPKAPDVAKAAVPPAPTQTGIAGGAVKLVPIEQIDLEDTTYRFRLDLRTGPLERSLKAQGLQVPIILRARGAGQKKHLLISGFRRVTAAKNLGWLEIGAIIREDLKADEDIFKAAVLENTERKTYSDIDRAMVIHEYRQRGFGGDDHVPMEVLGLTKRQQRNLLALLTLPKAAQQAIDDPEQHFSASHGLILRQHENKHGGVDWSRWLKAVNDAEMPKRQLTRELNADAGGKGKSGFTGLFRDTGTDVAGGVFRFNPVKIAVAEMSDADKKLLKAELEQVLATL